MALCCAARVTCGQLWAHFFLLFPLALQVSKEHLGDIFSKYPVHPQNLKGPTLKGVCGALLSTGLLSRLNSGTFEPHVHAALSL